MAEKKSMLDSQTAKEKLHKLKEYCIAKKIHFETWQDFNWEAYLIKLSHPKFSDLTLYITNEKDLDVALNVELEHIAGLHTLNGFVNLKDNFIEVQLAGVSVFNTIDKKRLFGPNLNEITINPKLQGPKIRIGPESNFFSELRSGTSSQLSIQFTGLNVNSWEDAEAQVKKYSGHLFLTILDQRKVSLRLHRMIRKGFRSRVKQRENESEVLPDLVLEYPRHEFSFVPASLLIASSDPLLSPSFQFLLSYQAIEFLLVRSNRNEAFRELKAIVDDKSFDTSDVKNLSKLLGAIKENWVNPMKREIEQLKVLLSNTDLLQSIRAFLKKETQTKEHWSTPHKFTDNCIFLEMSDKELVYSLTNRVYQIRNAIVHSKEDASGLRPQLLLQTSDEEIIDYDAFLVSHIARQVIEIYGKEAEL